MWLGYNPSPLGCCMPSGSWDYNQVTSFGSGIQLIFMIACTWPIHVYIYVLEYSLGLKNIPRSPPNKNICGTPSTCTNDAALLFVITMQCVQDNVTIVDTRLLISSGLAVWLFSWSPCGANKEGPHSSGVCTERGQATWATWTPLPSLLQVCTCTHKVYLYSSFPFKVASVCEHYQ